LDDRDYLPEDVWPAEDIPAPRYGDAYQARPAGRHRTNGHALTGMNGTHASLLTDAGRPGYPPHNGTNGSRYPASNGQPVTGYTPPNGNPIYRNPGPVPGYPPVNQEGRLPQGYRPQNGGPVPGYPPPGRGLPPGYAPANSGPMPAYRPPNGRPAPGYAPPNGNLVNGYPPPGRGPVPGYPRATSGPMPVATGPVPVASGSTRVYLPPNEEPASGYPMSAGRRILSWLPFGQRLVLLPKADGELREHRDVSGGWLRPAVFGAMDGLVTNSSLIAGVGGGGGVRGAIVLTGIAGLIAGAFSMATGEYISVTSQNELTLAEVELERKQHARDPQGKLRRLTEVFIGKGVSPNLAEAVVRQISSDTDRAVATHVREELGIDPDDLPSPRTAAVASFAAFTVGALLPLGPFLLGYPVLRAALVIAGIAAFAGGAAVAKLTGRPMLMGGLRQLIAASVATGMAFEIGHLVGGHVS
jgi:VIT1/CCC1 family predicted Fe2+/Mn2+ transporter